MIGLSTFNRHKLPDHRLYRDIGAVPERPFMMLAVITETSLGDLLSSLLFLATIKNQFDYAKLYVRYPDTRPYSKEVFQLLPDIDLAHGIRPFAPLRLFEQLLGARLWWPLALNNSADFRNRNFFDFLVID